MTDFQDRQAWMDVCREAYEKYLERDEKYKGLWKKGGWTDSAHHIRSKSERITTLLNGVASVSDAELYIEDAIDLINYCAFFVINTRAARASMGSQAKEPAVSAIEDRPNEDPPLTPEPIFIAPCRFAPYGAVQYIKDAEDDDCPYCIGTLKSHSTRARPG